MQWPQWVAQVITGLAAAGVLYGHLRGVWLGAQLRRHGLRVVGTVTGSQRDKSSVSYQVRFRTVTGQVVEGSSQGWRWNDPEYFEGDEVPLSYDAQHPDTFILEAELAPRHLYGRVAVAVGTVALLAGALAYRAARSQ